VPNLSGPATSTAAPAANAGPSPERLARVQAIAKPDTGDAGEDEYTYGFRLWEAGLFPEAQQQLQLFVERYPSHRMISYGRNLLGRAYLDDGQPRLAAPHFLENYQSDPGGARAPDSLLFLANAMIALEDTTRACRALAEFSEKYPALATGRLRDQYDKDRRSVSCG
jgi:TolA-binding protein